MDDGDGAQDFDRGMDLEDEVFDEELVVEELRDVPPDAIDSEFPDEKTRRLAAGLASQNEGERLAALDEMQKAVTGRGGENVLISYVLASPRCAELMSLWQAGPGNVVAVPLLLLLYSIFRHHGKLRATGYGYENDHSMEGRGNESHKKALVLKSRLDKLARSIVRTGMKDIYSHLSASQKSRQNAALLLLSAIVLRGRALAIEIATSFDFTLEALRKLGYRPKQGAQKVRVGGILKQPTRVAFIEFAMSFLSVGDPGLLRWILQKRPLWIGVLHGISKDDESTILQVLSLIQKKVMSPEFMVPRGLQSVLFGDATLEQLARISSDDALLAAGELAHAILLSLCTDPSHGLCPENPEIWEAASSTKSGVFGGGQGRLLRLLLRLKVTEVARHRDLLLATGRTRPKLATLYLASIPLSLEPRVSPAWFNAMSFISQLIPLASKPPPFSYLAARGLAPPAPDEPTIRTILLSLLPGSLSRVALNRGLLHGDIMVKHACLRVLLEALLSLRRLLNAVEAAASIEPLQESFGFGFSTNVGSVQGNSSVALSNAEFGEKSQKNLWTNLSQSIQDIMRASLPDPNTLLTILSTLKVFQSSGNEAITSSSKPNVSSVTKKRKRKEPEDDNEALNYDYDVTMMQLWGPDIVNGTDGKEEIESVLHAKVVQVLAAYQTVLPIAMSDNGFDPFKLLPDHPMALSAMQQKSLAALLSSTTGASCLTSEESKGFVGGFTGFGSFAYKKLKPLLILMLGSKVKEVRESFYWILHTIMASTGAFDHNPREILLWLDFLQQWQIKRLDISQASEEKITCSSDILGASLVDFLAEAVSNIGHSFYKYLDRMQSILAKYTLVEGTEHPCLHSDSALQDVNAPEFGPFVVCAIETCVKGIRFKNSVTAEHSVVAIYVASVLDVLLNYQVKPQPLAVIVTTLLSTEYELLSAEETKTPGWTSLVVLFHRAQSLFLNKETNHLGNMSTPITFSQVGKLSQVLKACTDDQEISVEAKFRALVPSLVLASGQELAENFPLLMRVFLEEIKGGFSVLVGLLGIRQDLLLEVSEAWPDIFAQAVEQAVHMKKLREDKSTVEDLGEVSGLCAVLLETPFSVLFSIATYSKQGLLLTSQSFSNLLQASLWRVHHQDWPSMMRLIISGLKHLANLLLEGIDVGSSLETSFSLIHKILLQSEHSIGGSCGPNAVIGSTSMLIYEHMILDILKHPVLLNLFMHAGWKHGQSTAPASCTVDLMKDFDDKVFDISLRRTLASAARYVHPIDCHILSLLTRFLVFSRTVVQKAMSFSEHFQKEVSDACNPFMMKAFCAFQKEIDECSKHGIVPSPALFSVSVLISYSDPCSLVSIFLSLLSKRAVKVKSCKQAVAPQVLGLHFVTVVTGSLSGSAPKLTVQGNCPQTCNKRNILDLPSIYDVYEKVIDQVTGSPSLMADLCLLSFLQAPSLKQYFWPSFENTFEGFHTCGSPLAHSTPLEVLKHCIIHPNKVTGKIAVLLVQSSSIHLSKFGRLLAWGTADRKPVSLPSTSHTFAETLLTHHMGNWKTEVSLSDQDLLSLLPAAHHYLASESKKIDMKANKVANHIATVYLKMFVKKFKHLDKFVSSDIPIDSLQNMSFPPSTSQSVKDLYIRFLHYYSSSALGQIAEMVRLCQLLHPFSMKVRNKLLQSFLPDDHVPLFKQDSLLSVGADVSCVFEAVAKSAMIRSFLFSSFQLQPERKLSEAGASEGDEITEESLSDGLARQKDDVTLQKFLGSLITTLGMLYRSKATGGGKKMGMAGSETGREEYRVQGLRFLEEYLLVQVMDVAKELAESSLDLSKFVLLFRYSMTTLLGYRYGEISAMRACRYLTFVLLQGLQHQTLAEVQSADADVLDLLIAHSKFLPTLLIMHSKTMDIPHISGKHVGKGTALNSLSSVLSLVGSPLLDASRRRSKVTSNQVSASQMDFGTKGPVALEMKGWSKTSAQEHENNYYNYGLDYLKKLELVKLLRILLGVRLKQSGRLGVQSVPLDEVLSILLAAYGGTMSEVDQEIFSLMQEIESHGGFGFPGLSALDYLWGEAALKRRKAQAEQATMNVLEEPEGIMEIRASTFKEDLVIDPRRCGLAVLFFPEKRNFGGPGIGQLDLASWYEEGSKGFWDCTSDANHEDLRTAAYDPAFILRFALHGLSVGFISAEDFVRLGLLAMSFASMSSAEENMRKAGYEVLAKYYSVLEDGPRFKGRLQIRLLMTYVKNAVTDPWQRLPAVFAVFAAEASCILMHPENHLYIIVNRFLLHAPSLDLENIPLFQVMFGSGSVHFRSDRLWMLRLLASGLKSSLDAHIYRRKFVLELLLSFHNSTLADTFPRKWVLQVLFQAATVRSCAQYLVEHTGLFSWLASVAVGEFEGDFGLQDDGDSGQIASMAVQIIECIMSWGSVQRYFLLENMEEPSKAVQMFHRFLVRNSTPQIQNIFRKSTIRIMLILVRLSHKRRKHQTQYILNLEGLLEVVHWFEIPSNEIFDSLLEDKTCALQLVLHTSPPSVCSSKDKLQLLKVATWALSVVLQLEMKNAKRSSCSGSFPLSHSKTGPWVEVHLSEKLLRWLVAAVIRSNMLEGVDMVESIEKFDTCFSVVARSWSAERNDMHPLSTSIAKKLAGILLTLEDHVTRKVENTSRVSVVAALVSLIDLARICVVTGDLAGDLAVQVAHRKIRSVLEILLLELPCPVEMNPSWLWSFNSPWAVLDACDSSLMGSALQARYVSEISQTVLMLVRQLLSRKPTQYCALLSRWKENLVDKSWTDGIEDPNGRFFADRLRILTGKLQDALQEIPTSLEAE